MKNICLLGATGSIGESTIDIIRANPNEYTLSAFSFNQNINKKQPKGCFFNIFRVFRLVYEEDGFWDCGKGHGLQVLRRLCSYLPERHWHTASDA